MSKRIVEVELEGFIWPSASGVEWTNQTHGLACCHPSLEGVFIPASVPVTVATLMFNVGAVYTLSDIGPNFLDEVDAAFAEAGQPFRVSRDHQGYGWDGGSGEAWLWVEVLENAGELEAFVGEKGVLVWGNSD